jgi:hypothetical protein
MQPATAVNEWFSRRRERREERRRKMKEHRDAIRDFLRVLSSATSYGERLQRREALNQSLMPEAQEQYEGLLDELGTASDQLQLLFPNTGSDQVLLEAADDAINALGNVATASSTAESLEDKAFSDPMAHLSKVKTEFIQAARVYTAL